MRPCRASSTKLKRAMPCKDKRARLMMSAPGVGAIVALRFDDRRSPAIFLLKRLDLLAQVRLAPAFVERFLNGSSIFPNDESPT